MIDADDDDWLDREFRKLELEIYQRSCEHEPVQVYVMGGPSYDICTRCGKQL